MPIFEFDEHENSRIDPRTGARLHNYWGYSTHSFFAPKAGFALSGRFGLQADELKNTVKALHRAGIEVILDVVFNHTSEGNEAGPIISFRGLDNATWYMLTPDGNYYNFSGTGNTVNCNHPVVRGFVLECLRYWAAEFHIDGFRFDLASILSRDVHGAPLPNPPLLESIAYDPVLRHCKLIAEAWDAGGLNEVGRFPAYGRWSEWNGCYRDAVRRFVKGDPGVVGEMASRLVGSPDLYAGRGPLASVNFVTAHDGFTLADLVSYNEKHNDANGEDSQDGTNDNLSWNCGAEGPTDDRAVLELRRRQVRNFLALLFASHGVPMLLGGDELGRSQDGNNNAYCHDNEQVWLDWRLVERNADLLRFTRNLIALRRRHPALRRTRHPTGDRVEGLDVPEVSWHGRWPDQPDWSWESRLLVVMQATADPAPDAVLVLANAHWEAAEVRLPEPPTGQAWHLAVDTAAGSGFDSYQPGTEPRLADLAREGRDPGVFLLGPRTVAVLVGAAHDTGGTG
ncbi:MAG TPA: alpha-amylase family glycosyl hydrolase, partial [Mycobacteriales bacterium]|nr:alpha-amylase family glycosyl hydrolase [Mycobacteriales bacterium]